MRHGRPSISKSFAAAPIAGSRSPSPPTPPPPTSSPTREYRQHHVVEAPRIDAEVFHPAFRVKTRLFALAESGKIDRRKLEGAVIWRRWHETIGRFQVQSWEVRVGHSMTSGTLTPYQSLAAEQLRACLAALGPTGCACSNGRSPST
jgi:hypothetical protein